MPGADARRSHLVPLAATQAAGIACGVIGVRWTTGVIPPDLLGHYGLLLSATQAALTVTHQGLVRHTQETWSRETQAGPHFTRLLRAARTPTLWLAAGLVPVFLLLHRTGGVPLGAGLYGWLLLANLGVVVVVVAQNALQAEERYWPAFATSALASATRSFGPPLLVMLCGASLVAVTGAYLFHLALTALAAGALLRAAWARPARTEVATAGELESALRTFALSGLYGWVATAAARWIAAPLLGPEETGYFVLAGNLGLIIPAAVSGVMLSYSFPHLFARARAGETATALQAMTHRTLVLVFATAQAGLVLLALAAPRLIGPVIAARYAPATDWLLAAGGVTLAAAATPYLQNLLLAAGRPQRCAQLALVSLLLRAGVMLAGAALGRETFRLALVALPWVTLPVEVACTHAWLREARPA